MPQLLDLEIERLVKERPDLESFIRKETAKIRRNKILDFDREDSGHARPIEDITCRMASESGVNGLALDLGCGDSNILVPNTITIYRCDIWDCGLDNFIKCDLNNYFPFKDNKFNLIFAIEVLEHVENPWRFFRECKRVGKENSIMIFSFPSCDTPKEKRHFCSNGWFSHFPPNAKQLKYRKGFKHITPIFKWQLRMIFELLNFKPERGILLDTEYGEIVVQSARILKKENY